MRIYHDFDLTNHNAYKLKASCKLAIFPETEQDIVELYKNRKEFTLLGSGHNVILSKPYYDEAFVIFNGNFDKIELDESKAIISAEAGATILALSEVAQENGLTGAEFFYDIPSSVGGAVVMNAGTKEGETKDILIKVRYLDLVDMVVKERADTELELGYRNSIFQKLEDKIILKAWFKLENGDPEDIRELMEASKARRWARQPREFPNCGSVYKRPKGYFVGPMIDELGLKGYTVGGAQISEKHSGFIINKQNASGEDILAIIAHTRKAVKDRFGIELEVEQRII